MIRVLSGAVLIAVAVAAVWLAPSWLFFLIAQAVLLLAFTEYARLAAACGLPIPVVAAGAATMLASVGVTSTAWADDRVVGTAIALDSVLMSAFIVLAAMALGAYGAPARERRGAEGSPQATEPGYGAEPHMKSRGDREIYLSKSLCHLPLSLSLSHLGCCVWGVGCALA